MANIVATADIDIAASPALVWRALIDPAQIKEYMFGSVVETDWAPGSRIVWKGEYKGTPYEDEGEIVAVEPERLLVLTHFSPISGQPDLPENYHALRYELAPRGDGTHLSLSQDHNSSEDEAARARDTWSMMLAGLKEFVERARA